ncbi:MAG TPA: hypothetical protein VGC07_09520 [Granulicella sp.]
MLAEWSAECSVDAPVLIVPWSDPNGTLRYIDLRANPHEIDHLPEAEQNPPLMQALRALNAPRSAVFTAKCDAWALSLEERETLLLNIDPTLSDVPVGFGSYIDLVPRERTLLGSFPQQEQLLGRLMRRAVPLDHPLAALECIIRPVFLEITTPQEGYSISLYVKALGADAQDAWQNWAAALESVVALLRSKDLSLI